jgi:hypothetical protein
VGVLLANRARLLAIALAASGAVALSVATPAAAQPFSGGPVTSPSSVTLGIPVTASVSASCAFTSAAPNGTYAVPNLMATWTNDFPFVVACTGPFRVGVVSANGALLAPGAGETGYTTSAPYNVALDLKGDTLDSGFQTCAAAGLTAAAASPCATFRGPASTTAGLKLAGASTTGAQSTVRVSAPAYAGSAILVASTGYTDTLTVTLSPST